MQNISNNQFNGLQLCNNIRKAEILDLTRLTEIYNQAILTKLCTCDTETFTVQERKKWFDEHQENQFPIFVYERKGKVVGYSYISPYRSGRNALRFVCEISYYIDFDYHRQGIGSQLVDYTIREAKDYGFKNLIAILLSCNCGSVTLLKKLGFSQWGILSEIAHFEDISYSHLYYGKKI